MAGEAGARWIPLSNGGITLQDAAGNVLLTVSSLGAVTYGAAVTVQAVTIPSMTTTQRDALSATAGALIYNTSTAKLNVRVAAAWEAITSA